MDALSQSQRSKVALLVDMASDRNLANLDQAMAGDRSGSAAMAEIRSLIADEISARRVRDRVLAPIIPLCGRQANRLAAIDFPRAIPSRLWRALVDAEPRLIRRAELDCSAANEDAFPDSHDELCLRAAKGLRGREAGFAAVADLAERHRAGGSAELASCLDLARTARRASARLPGWLGRLTEERIASARLTVRDAAAIAEDASPRLMEMLLAQLPEPSLVLRLIAAVMDRPSDTYAAASEMGAFGERLLDEIDRLIGELAGFRPDDGRAAGVAAAAAVEAAAVIVADFDSALELTRTGPWAVRLMQQKRRLSAALEGRLRQAEDAAAQALPVQSRARRGVRGRPRLSADPEPLRVACAEAYAALVQGVRGSSTVIGFGAQRQRVIESLQERLDQYVEDLLETLHAEEEPAGEEAARVRAFLDVAAELAGLLTGQKAAQIVRRRVAAA